MIPLPTLLDFLQEQNSDLTGTQCSINHIVHAMSMVARNMYGKANGLNGLHRLLHRRSCSGKTSRLELEHHVHSQFRKTLVATGLVCGMPLENGQDFLALPTNQDTEQFIVSINTVSVSSEAVVDSSIGTLFSVFRRLSPPHQSVVAGDFLQPGRMILAAGYVLYGTSTHLVYSLGNGVHRFTLNKARNEFLLSKERVVFPVDCDCRVVSHVPLPANQAGLSDFIEWCQSGRPVNRTIGSLISDFNQCLIHGGVGLYPRSKDQSGMIPGLLQDCIPIAFLAGQAEGLAIDGKGPILEIQPLNFFHRSSLYFGSKPLVESLKGFIETKDDSSKSRLKAGEVRKS